MIWKALSDPTRRSILDILAVAPRTTGELSMHFKDDLSRFAIMKHLGILQKADLIIIKREGKFRWNHLNPNSIQRAYEGWLKKYQEKRADNIVQFQQLSGVEKPIAMNDKKVATAQISFSVKLNASKNQVWKALTTDIGKWWGKDFCTSPNTKKFVLDAQIGGLMYEDAGSGQGLVWGMVIGVDKPNSLQIKGHLSAEFGGPAVSFQHFKLEEKGKTTELKFSDTIFGAIDDGFEKSLTKGWKDIFGKALKAYLDK